MWSLREENMCPKYQLCITILTTMHLRWAYRCPYEDSPPSLLHLPGDRQGHVYQLQTHWVSMDHVSRGSAQNIMKFIRYGNVSYGCYKNNVHQFHQFQQLYSILAHTIQYKIILLKYSNFNFTRRP